MTEKILKIAEVCEATGLSRSGIYRAMSEGTFPCQVRLSSRRVGWVEHEVLQWVDLKILDRDIGVGQ